MKLGLSLLLLSELLRCRFQVWAAAWGEREAEAGINADRRTNPGAPGETGATSAGSHSKVAESHHFIFYTCVILSKVKNLKWKWICLIKKKRRSHSVVHRKRLFLWHVSISSLVVDKQPPQVIKTQSKFSTTVRYLLGDKVAPGKPMLLKAQIITEAQARNLGQVPKWVSHTHTHKNESRHKHSMRGRVRTAKNRP